MPGQPASSPPPRVSWAPRICSLFGIEFRIHVTFLVLLVFLWFAHWLPERSLEAAMTGVAFFLLIFTCVVLHELGHALAARQFGIQTRDITLLPIGGVARLERMPEKPLQELWVAFAGPLVNVVIAAILFAALSLTGHWEPVSALTVTKGNLAERLFAANVSLVIFNLLPAFPMDGGRVLRAFLAIRMPYVRATRIAARIGQGMALLFGLVGVLQPQPMLVLIAFFVWAGAEQEASAVEMKSTFAGVPVRDAMLTQFQALSPTETLGGVARLLLAGTQKDFPVVDADGQVIGILTHAKFFEALAEHGDDAPVTVSMTEAFDTADVTEPMEIVFSRARPENCNTVPVLRDGVVVGMLTAENIGEFILIDAARKRFG